MFSNYSLSISVKLSYSNICIDNSNRRFDRIDNNIKFSMNNVQFKFQGVSVKIAASCNIIFNSIFIDL